MASGGSTEVAAGYVALYARMDAGQVAAEITDALSGLNAASIASGLLDGIGSAADTLGTKLSVLGAAAIVGATKLTSGLFDTISTAENTAIAFETMLGSADLAADAMGRLNEFAIKTPYEFDNIATSSKQLLAMGVDFDKQLNESGEGILQWAGNWASALGLNDAGFSNILTQFGHINAAGRVYTRNITALSRNGIAAWQALSDYMGISIDEVRGLVQKGEVDAETALAAFESYANEHFLGTMDEMAHTMTGIMSNISDAIKVPIMALRDTSAYENLTNAMYDLTDPMRELVEALMPSVEVMFDRAAPVVRGFTDKVVELADALRKGNPDDLVRGLEAIAMVLGSGPLLKGFGMLSSGLGGFLGMSANVGKGIVSYLYKPLTALSQVKWGETISGYFGTLRSGFGTLGDMAKTGFTSFVNGVSNMAGGIAGTVSGIAESMAPSIRKVASLLDNKLVHITGDISSRILEDIWTVKLAFKENMAPVLSDAGNAMKGFARTVGNSLSKVPGIVTNVLRLNGVDLTAVKTRLVDAFANVVTRVYEDMITVMLAYRNNMEPVLNDISGAFGRAVAPIREKAGALFAGISSTFGKYVRPLTSSFAEAFSAAVPGMLDGIKGAVSQIPKALSGVAKLGAQFGRVAAQVVKPFAVLFGTTLKTGLTAFSQFAGVMMKGGSAFGVVALGATLAAGALTAMGGDLVSLGAEVADVLGSIGGTASDALGAFASGLSSLAESGGIKTFFVSLTSGINGFVSQVGAQLPAVFSAVGAAFPQFVSGLIGMFQTYAPMLLTGAMQLFSGLLTGLTSIISQITPAIPGFVSSIASTIAANMPAILSGGVELFMALVDAFVTTIPAVLDELPSLIDSLVMSLESNFPNIMAGATKLFNAIAEAIPVIVPLAISALGRLLSSLVRTFPTWGPQFLSAMGNVLISLLNAIVKAIPNAVSAVKNLLSSARSAIANTNWASLGRNLIQGFINGIRNMASSVLNAALSVVHGAANAVKSFLGIASPSRLFRDYGEMTMAGMALGIDKGADGVMDAMDSVMGDLAPTSLPSVGLDAYANGGRGTSGGSSVVNNYYIDGELALVDARMAAALDVVASCVSTTRRMGVTA